MAVTTEFFEAVRVGDMDRVGALLRGDSSLASATNERGISALLWALYNGQPKVADRLIASGIELNIFEAAAAGDVARTRALLASDPSLASAHSADGFSPLGLAAFFGRLEVLDLLLSEGADPNAASRNSMRVTPLHSAAAHRGAETALRMVDALLRSGANPNAQQHGGWTPLQQAAAHGQLEMVELLLASGADAAIQSDDGLTAADKAAAGGFRGVEERLRRG